MRQLLVTLCVVLLSVGTLIAQGKGNGKKPAYSIAVVMVFDANNDGLPNWDDIIRFDVGTPAANSFVSLSCFQGTEWVLAAGGYPLSFPITLAASSWPEHTAAECTVTYFTTIDGSHNKTLATLTFPVAA